MKRSTCWNRSARVTRLIDKVVPRLGARWAKHGWNQTKDMTRGDEHNAYSVFVELYDGSGIDENWWRLLPEALAGTVYGFTDLFMYRASHNPGNGDRPTTRLSFTLVRAD